MRPCIFLKSESNFPLSKLLGFAADTALAHLCILCGVTCKNRSSVCAACAGDLPILADDCCPVCALPSVGCAICGQCLTSPRQFDATTAIYQYQFPVDKLVQALKYSRRLASADFLSQALVNKVTDARPDVLLPVPLSRSRLRERGFNQAAELARPLSKKFGIPMELFGVRRIRDTSPQAMLPWKSRARNVRRAFECSIDLSGKTVWIVDDVMTTGATLDELAGVLKLHGALRVENWVIARAFRH